MIISLDDKDLDIGDGYRKNAKGIINRIARHNDWKVDVLDTDQYEANYDKVVEAIKTGYGHYNTRKAKLLICSLRKILNVGGYNGILLDWIENIPNILVNREQESDNPQWSEIVKWLDELVQTGNKGVRTIATIYKHGYFPTQDQISETSTIESQNTYWIDLEKQKWHLKWEILRLTNAFIRDLGPISGPLVQKESGEGYRFTNLTIMGVECKYSVPKMKQAFSEYMKNKKLVTGRFGTYIIRLRTPPETI